MLNFDSTSVVQRVSAIAAAVYTPLGLALNILLLMLIRVCKNDALQDYKVVLVHTGILDIVVVCMDACLQYSQFFENGYTSGMINTSLRDYFSSGVSTGVCNVFMVLLYYAQFVTTVNFLFRYVGVVHGRPVSAREYGGMLSILLLILTAFFTWDVFLTVPVEGTETVMTDEYVEKFGGGGPNGTDRAELRVCIRGDLAPLVSKFWDYSFFAFMNLMYGLLFYCSARIFCHVHTNTMAGGGVERIHTQINVVLALQTVQPLVNFVNSYICYIVSIFRLDTDMIAWMAYANLYTAIFIASASVINPLVVVCGIAKYRRFVLAKLTFGFLSNSKPQATKVIRVSPTSNGLTVGGLGTMTATNQQQEQKPAAVSA